MKRILAITLIFIICSSFFVSIHFQFTSGAINSNVGYWKFDEGSGLVASDSSGNDNTGTLGGPQWIAGISGSALRFDGVNDYVSIPTSSSLAVQGSAMSLEAWINPGITLDNSVKNIVSIIDKGDEYTFQINPNDNRIWFAVILQPGLNWQGITTTTSTWSAGTWYHLAGTYDGSTLRIYVNGALQNSKPLSGNLNYPTSFPFTIGAHSLGYNLNFNGAMDEVKVYSSARTTSQISDDYNGVTPTPTVTVPPTPTPIANQKPSAVLSASPNYGGQVISNFGANVDFSGINSKDPDGTVTAYFFDYGNNYNSGWINYPNIGVTYVYPQIGTFTAQLKVRDNLGLESDWSNQITVIVGSPTGTAIQTPTKSPTPTPKTPVNPTPTTTNAEIDVLFEGVSYQVILSLPSTTYKGIDSQWLTQFYPQIDQNTLKAVDYLYKYLSDPTTYPIANIRCLQNGLDTSDINLKNQIIYNLFLYCYELGIAVSPNLLNVYSTKAVEYFQYGVSIMAKCTASDALSNVIDLGLVLRPLSEALKLKFGPEPSVKVENAVNLIVMIYERYDNLVSTLGSQKADYILSILIDNHFVSSKDYSTEEIYSSFSQNPEKSAAIISEIEGYISGSQMSLVSQNLVANFFNEMKNELLSVTNYLPASAVGVWAYFGSNLPASWAAGAAVSTFGSSLISSIVPIALANAIDSVYVYPMNQMLHMSYVSIENLMTDYINLNEIGTSIATPLSNTFDLDKSKTFASIYGLVNVESYVYNMNMYLYKSQTVLASASETATHLDYANADLAAAKQWISTLGEISLLAKKAVTNAGNIQGVNSIGNSNIFSKNVLTHQNQISITTTKFSINQVGVTDLKNIGQDLHLPALSKDSLLSASIGSYGFAIITNETFDVTLKLGEQAFTMQNDQFQTNFANALYVDDSLGYSYLMMFSPLVGNYSATSMQNSINWRLMSFEISDKNATIREVKNSNKNTLSFKVASNSESTPTNSADVVLNWPNQQKPSNDYYPAVIGIITIVAFAFVIGIIVTLKRKRRKT